ncbi:helix-turn-helix transcriptional regulator [Neobacillus sp. PS3-40]|jgi:transcriptional regulator with XRE-family HTH domain|uniref:helix-turn-helix domain-containing protein n=1 Tax=Neobacillus sp. PS3-40 TaxID=3070679 RepID=UPI0027DF20A8|nr:helix-turn-helix transcriptional regulator [Neobacillus sp. PS3-40]WML46208.1 helix-turn-helix transcriptional regulator [Neobacillus sp. PS3-40]
MSLSEKLKQLRDSRNWSQQYLADKMKLDRSTISRYETGKSIPPYEIVIQFAEAYQVEKDYLVVELNNLLSIKEKAAYILKENPLDKDLEAILQLVQQEPDLKSILMDINIMESNRRAYFLEKTKAEMKVLKKYKWL